MRFNFHGLFILAMISMPMNFSYVCSAPLVEQSAQGRGIALSSKSRVFEDATHKRLSLYSFENILAENVSSFLSQISPENVSEEIMPATVSSALMLDYVRKQDAARGQTKILQSKIYYKVKAGDTVQKIARKFNASVKNIMRLNNMKSDFLREGQKLFVGLREKVIEIPYIDENSIRQEVSLLKETLTTNEEKPEQSMKIISEKIVEVALKYIGFPYKYGGESLWGIDCSAFVRRVWGFFGLELPRTSKEQFLCGEKTDLSDLQPGDLVFFRRRGRKNVSHVGIYIGDSKFVHASGSDHRVTISNLTQEYYSKYFKGARRVINFLFPDLMMDTESSNN